MSSLFWISLVVMLIAATAGAIVLGVRALAAWRVLGTFQRRLARSLAELEDSLARAERRLAKAGEASARLAGAQSRLQSSLATAAVLADAAGETRALLGAVRAFMPRK